MTEIIFLSLKVATGAMLFVLPLAIIVARILANTSIVPRTILSSFVHLPLVLPPVVTGYLLLILFRRDGAIGAVLESLGVQLTFSWIGAALAAAVMAFPLVVRPIRLAFEQADDGLEEIAATLGANRWSRFFRVALPMAWPGIIAGFVLGFAKALGEFGATITFVSNIPGETQTLSLAIYTLLQSPQGDSAALTLIGVSIALSLIAVIASEIIMNMMSRRSEK